MPRRNDEVARAFDELADLLEIAGADRFKILAYRRVAEELRATARDISTMGERELAGLRGVGRATASKIREAIETGTMGKLEEARASVPRGIREMTALPGLGPRKALLLHSQLGIATLEQLDRAIKEQRLRAIKGLGRKTEENLARALAAFRGAEHRVPIDLALDVAESMLADLNSSGLVTQSAYCGSLRRMKETIGDVDLLASGTDARAIMSRFTGRAGAGSVTARGPTRSSVTTGEGISVDLRVVTPGEFGAALQYFTGSKEHNVRVREIAVKQGYKLSEYGLFRVSDNVRVAGATEEEVYHALGLQTPPPTMRENRGEIELAARGELPHLVELSDLRGDLHSHTTFSDGVAGVRQMALAAADEGHGYLAITDHLDASVKSHSVQSILQQAEEIRAVNRELGGAITILQGVEVDIGREGDLALPDAILAEVDLVIASIHRRFGLGPEAMTARVVKALSHPAVNIFGHPTGRWLGSRPAAEFDLATVFRTARDHGVALEVNSNPARLDLKDDHLRLAKELGCMFSIATDAHNPAQLRRMRLGAGMAQRGWLSASEVINTRALPDLRRLLAKA